MLSRKNDNKLSGWKEKILSQAEKEIFIKAVAQASPTAVVTPETVKSGLTHREVFSQSVAPTKLHSPSLPRPTQVEHPLTKLNTSSGVQSGFFTSHPKLKTFTWRAWRNILPTKVNLCHHGVLEDATCEACQLDEETSRHLFWHCTRALETWEAIGLPLDTRGVHFREFIDLIWDLIFVQHVGTDMLELIITLSRCAWYNRNKSMSMRLSSRTPSQWVLVSLSATMRVSWLLP